MDDKFHFGMVNSGNTIFGGSNNSINAPGTVNVGSELAEIRPLLMELLSVIQAQDSTVSPQVREDAEQALAELDSGQSEPGRLRGWIDRVVAGSGHAAAIAESAGKVIEALTRVTP